MRLLLDALAVGATRRPRAALAALAAFTAGFAVVAANLEVEVDLTALRSEGSAPGRAMDRVEEEFADPAAAVQVILDTGRGGDLLTTDGLEAVREAERITLEALGPAVRTDEEGEPLVRSLETAVGPVLAELDEAVPLGPPAEVTEQLAGASEAARRLVDGLAALLEGTAALTQRVSELDADPGAAELGSVRERLAQLRAGLAGVAEGLDAVATGVAGASEGVARLRDEIALPSEEAIREAWEVLTEDFTVGAADPAYPRALEAVGETFGRLRGEDPRTGERRSADYAGLSAALGEVADGLAGAVGGLERLRGRVSELDAGLARLGDGLTGIGSGRAAAGPGLAQLRERVGNLHDGAARLHEGASELTAGLTGAVERLEGADERPAEIDVLAAALRDAQLGIVSARMLTANPRLAGLVSDDVDIEAGRARATVLVALLDPSLDEEAATDAAERVRDAFARRGTEPTARARAAGTMLAASGSGERDALEDVDVTVFSPGLFTAGLLGEIRAEVPQLFGLALLVVLGILVFMYRSAFDVAVGFAGLLATVVWTFGLAALLGPAFLGWTGPLSQLAVVIPVLLVGLGIDYSVHLTARYREQRAAGHGPDASARRALRTVGTALVLATIATAAGFGSMAVAPLGLLADFGVFVAIGVASAFVIMGVLVPAAQVWRDRRRAGETTGAVHELRLVSLMRAPVWLAGRAPAAGLAVAALLAAASLVAATGLAVEFDRDDFVPEGSGVEAVLAQQRALFGGGLTESTFVLVDGDLTDPAVANALLEAEDRVGEVEGVRSIDGTPQVVSAVSLAARLEPDGRTGEAFAPGADLEVLYAELRGQVGDAQVDQLLARDAQAALVQIRTTAGDAGAARIKRAVERAFAPVENAGADVTVTSEPLIIAEMSEELTAFQVQAIALTLAVVLALLAAYYGLARRRPLLGAIAMAPALASAALVLGTMRLAGVSFNVMTATLTAIAIGIGVPYGVHVVNRFTEDLGGAGPDDAIARTLHATGAALTASALTTLGAFTVLAFSGLPPIRSLGLLGGAAIAFALLAALLVQPGVLVLWARRGAASH